MQKNNVGEFILTSREDSIGKTIKAIFNDGEYDTLFVYSDDECSWTSTTFDGLYYYKTCTVAQLCNTFTPFNLQSCGILTQEDVDEYSKYLLNKEEERRKIFEDIERQQYLKLKAKFEGE